MPESVYRILTEFEVDNEKAIDATKKQTKATEDLNDSVKKVGDSYSFSQADIDNIAARRSAQAAKQIEEQRKVRVEETKKFLAAAKAKKLEEQALEANKKTTTQLSKFSRIIASATGNTTGFGGAIKQTAQQFGGLVSSAGLVVAVLLLIGDALRRVGSVMEFARGVGDRLVITYQVLSSTIGNLLAGNVDKAVILFNSFNDTVEEGIKLRKESRTAEIEFNATTEEGRKNLILLNDELKENLQVRKELSELGDARTGAIQEILIKDEITLRRQIVNLQLAEIEGSRALLVAQEKLQDIASDPTPEIIAERKLARAKLLTKETEINSKFNAEINKLLNVQNDLTEKQADEARKLALFRENIFKTLDFNLIIRDPEKVAEEAEKQFRELLEDIEKRVDSIDTEFGRQFIVALNEGLGPEAATALRDDNIFDATIDVLEKGSRDINQLLRLTKDQINRDTKALAGTLPEYFSEAQKVVAEELELTKEQARELEAALVAINKRIQELTTSNDEANRKRSEAAKQKFLQDAQDAFSSLNDIFSSLGDASQEALDKQNNLIENQIDLIDRLKENTLEANSDIIDSEESKLSRLLEGRRKYTNQVREFARLEFVASTASAIAQAAASGVGAVPQILAIVAAVISGLAQLRSAATFHSGTESVGDKDKYTSGPLKSDEVYAKLQKKERVLSVKQNARVANLSNWELVKAGEMYSANFNNQMIAESKYDQLNNKLLKDIREGLSAMQFHVNMDQRGFSAGLYNYMTNQSKIQSVRR